MMITNNKFENQVVMLVHQHYLKTYFTIDREFLATKGKIDSMDPILGVRRIQYYGILNFVYTRIYIYILLYIYIYIYI